MQFVNDDMDDLFRRAAEEYPLSAKGADWDKVAQKLAETEVEPSVVNRKESKAKYLWLLLLLPMVFICNRYVGKNKNKDEAVTGIHKEVSGLEGETTNGMKKVDQKTNQNKSVYQPSTINPAHQPARNKTIQANNNSYFLPATTEEKANPITENKNTTKENKKVEKLTRTPKRVNPIKANADAYAKTETIEDESSKTTANVTVGKESSVALLSVSKSNPQLNLNKVQLTYGTPLFFDKKQPAAKVKQFYTGVLVAPDISLVKGSKVPSVGYGFGLLAGYRLSKRWSIETGVLWDRKKYYSEGQYFNYGKTSLPTHAIIIDATGSCNMFELPLTVQYHFGKRLAYQWFAAAGVSSYLMKKEDYNYTYERYGMKYQSYKIYRNASQNWFSVIQVSAGYQKQINRFGMFRIEPYLKLPVKGIGIGKLPLTSTGVSIGITRPIR